MDLKHPRSLELITGGGRNGMFFRDDCRNSPTDRISRRSGCCRPFVCLLRKRPFFQQAESLPVPRESCCISMLHLPVDRQHLNATYWCPTRKGRRYYSSKMVQQGRIAK